MDTYEKLRLVHAERVQKLASMFLEHLYEKRTDRQALKSSGLNKGMLRKLLKRDHSFAIQYEKVHSSLSNTRTCRKCSNTYIPEGFRCTSSGYSICKKCSTLSTLVNQSTKHGRIIRILSSSAQRHECLIDEEWVTKQFMECKGKCWLSGQQMIMNPGPDCISLDRIDTSIGYTEKNTKLSRRRSNLMRGSLKVHDFISLCESIVMPINLENRLIDLDLVQDPIHKLIRDAKRRKWEFELDQDFLVNMVQEQGGRCFYSGRYMYLRKGGNVGSQISLDRKNPKMGYIKNNVVLCRLDINRMKYNVDECEFRKECQSVVHNAD